jgi:hypothetical protein
MRRAVRQSSVFRMMPLVMNNDRKSSDRRFAREFSRRLENDRVENARQEPEINQGSSSAPWYSLIIYQVMPTIDQTIRITNTKSETNNCNSAPNLAPNLALWTGRRKAQYHLQGYRSLRSSRHVLWAATGDEYETGRRYRLRHRFLDRQ